MVEVEERRLRTLEQHRVPLRHLAVQDERDVGDPRAVALAERDEVGHDAVPVDVGRAARAPQHLLVVPARLGQLVGQRLRAEEVAERHPAAARLVLVRRADAAQRGADLARAALLLGQRLEAAVVREDEVSAVGENEVVADLDAGRRELARLLLERDGVDDDAVADDTQDPGVQDAGRHEVQDVLAAADDDRVARVVAAVVAGDHLHARREKVDDLPLPLVAPLGAGDHDVGHVSASGSLLGPFF